MGKDAKQEAAEAAETNGNTAEAGNESANESLESAQQDSAFGEVCARLHRNTLRILYGKLLIMFDPLQLSL